MSFTSLSFVFAFLPMVLAIYYLSKDEAKQYILLAISLVFYAFGSLRYIVLFCSAICITVLIGRTLYNTESQKLKKILLAVGVVGNVSLLAFYKYADIVIEKVNAAKGLEPVAKNYVLPLGISYFTFKAISYLVDVYKGKAVLTDRIVRDALYLSFFTQIQSGPLSRYSDSAPVDNKGFNSELFCQGIYRFVVGFCKKVILANMLSKIYLEVYATPFENFSTPYAWLGAISFLMEILFDFEGYSDMAIGISNMFGYRCMENFNYPYWSKTVGEFWRRWHISLGAWFRDYIYIPLGGSKGKYKWQVYFNLLVVWLVTGMWHGTGSNYILWALGMFVAISIEKIFNMPGRFKSKAAKIIYQIVSVTYLIGANASFASDSFINGLRFVKRMFIFCSNEAINKRAAFLFKDNWFILIVGLFLCFPIVPWIENKLEGNKLASKTFDIAKITVIAFGFLWALSFVVAGQNNPFAYANF